MILKYSQTTLPNFPVRQKKITGKLINWMEKIENSMIGIDLYYLFRLI